MKTKAVLIMFAIYAFLLACDPGAFFLSSRSNRRYEVLTYDNFSVMVDIGGLLHSRQRYISFVFDPVDKLLVHTKKLQIYYKGRMVTYSVNNVNEIVSVDEKNQWISYGFTPRPEVRGGDTISIFGPAMFQWGDKLYDLDTLNFIMKEPLWWQ